MPTDNNTNVAKTSIFQRFYEKCSLAVLYRISRECNAVLVQKHGVKPKFVLLSVGMPDKNNTNLAKTSNYPLSKQKRRRFRGGRLLPFPQ